ncbi:hypothetical protein PoB_005738100 [Plakobranchus ocellatus]|uniref:Uncharacterized protein n=1 Tax=Plakobranchus ocellatus TaxID=259542 RepID=A0AAV4CDP7_9GAST|nr:hypothetical protein PoB_005738100 [Plakobranchus ocellatus]
MKRLNKLVKKKRRARQQIEKNIVNGRGPEEAYKGRARKKVSGMIKENGESTTDRDEITICQTSYMKLYEQTTSDQSTTLTPSPDKEKIPPFLEPATEGCDKRRWAVGGGRWKAHSDPRVCSSNPEVADLCTGLAVVIFSHVNRRLTPCR